MFLYKHSIWRDLYIARKSLGMLHHPPRIVLVNSGKFLAKRHYFRSGLSTRVESSKSTSGAKVFVVRIGALGSSPDLNYKFWSPCLFWGLFLCSQDVSQISTHLSRQVDSKVSKCFKSKDHHDNISPPISEELDAK